jgi:transposase
VSVHEAVIRRGHLGRLPAHRRRLPQPRPSRSEDRTKKDHRDDHRGRAYGTNELITLGRTLERRAADVLAYFDRAGTKNGRIEHLRGSALGFRNLTNYIARSLLETGGFEPQLHRQSG